MMTPEEIKLRRAEYRRKNRDAINAKKRQYHAANVEAIRIIDKLRYEANKEKVKARVKARADTVRESIKEYNKIYRAQNIEKKQAYDKAYNRANKYIIAERKKIYKQQNRDKFNAWGIKRKCAKLKRTPPWLTTTHLQEIQHIYALSVQLTKETGILHHVDHIVPLQGENVSGLHVPWNLRAIPFYENCSKSNKLIEI